MTVSIITVSYNDKNGLIRTLESIQQQTSIDYELILMDGGSTDGSVEVFDSYKEIITYSESEKDGGVYFGMNKAISHVNGDYCIFMNSGDSFYNEEVIAQFVDSKPKADIISGICCEHINGVESLWYPPKENDFCFRWFYRHSLSHQATFIKTSLMEELMYDTNFRIVSDWKFFMEAILIKRCSYACIDLKVCHYQDGGISRNAEKAFAEREEVIKSLFGNRILRDCHSMEYGTNDWDALAKKVDYNSKIGKLIFIITRFLLKLRR